MSKYTTSPHKDGMIFHCNVPGCGTRCLVKDSDDLAKMVRIHYMKNCPNKNNKLRLGGGALTSIIQQMWAEVDSVLGELMKSDGDTTHLKGQLHGMTKMIQLISTPYYPTHDDVKREAVTRREDRLAGRHHMTPGCETITIMPGGKPVANAAERIPTPWEREHRAAPVAASGAGRPTTRTPATKRDSGATAKHFSPEDVVKIKAAHAAGFDLKMLAVANKCTEDNIKAVLESE